MGVGYTFPNAEVLSEVPKSINSGHLETQVIQHRSIMMLLIVQCLCL